eukprot:g16892.t1
MRRTDPFRHHKVSMIPVIMRNDPSLAARPRLRREMEDWSGEFFGTDFTRSSSMRSVLSALARSSSRSERLALAVSQDDFRETQRLLSEAEVTPALHLALKLGAAPEDGADVNAVGRGCETALHIVARMLQVLLAEEHHPKLQLASELRTLWHDLVARGADASMVDGEGFSAIQRWRDGMDNDRKEPWKPLEAMSTSDAPGHMSEVLHEVEALMVQQRQEMMKLLRRRFDEVSEGSNVLPGSVGVTRSAERSRASDSLRAEPKATLKEDAFQSEAGVHAQTSLRGGMSKPSLGTAIQRKQTARSKMEQQMLGFGSIWGRNAMSFLIVANALILGLQVQLVAEEAAQRAARLEALPQPSADAFFFLHWFFCIVFTADLGLRWWADGFWDFFQGVDAGWNIFDIFVVAFAIIDVLVDTIFLSSGMMNSILQSRRSFTTLRVLRVVRIIRVLRVVRMLTFFRELRMMIHSTIGCFKSVFFVMLIFGAMLYIFGIAFTSAFIDHMSQVSMWQELGSDRREPKYQDLIRYFGSVTISGLSLYQAMSNGREWHIFIEALETMEGQVWSYIFLLYTLVSIFAIAFFRAIKLDYRDAQLLFDLLDQDQSGKVTVDEFIDGCAKLQGEASALETKVLHLEVQMVRRQLDNYIRYQLAKEKHLSDWTAMELRAGTVQHIRRPNGPSRVRTLRFGPQGCGSRGDAARAVTLGAVALLRALGRRRRSPRTARSAWRSWAEELGIDAPKATVATAAEVSAAFLEASNGVRFSFSEADFTWAVQTVRSRAFTGPYEGRGPQDRVAQLAFIAALLAASTGLGVVSLENGLNGALAAAVAIPLSELRRVCINYGEQRSNDTLLQFYGFVERDNANDTYTMEILQHLDVATDAIVEVTLTRTGPTEESMQRLLEVLGGEGPEEEDMAWKAVALACEAELQRRSAGVAHEASAAGTGPEALAARFAAEKEKVLIACRAHAQSRC